MTSEIDLLEQARILRRRRAELEEELEYTEETLKALEKVIEHFELEEGSEVGVREAMKTAGKAKRGEKFSSTDLKAEIEAKHPHLKGTHRATYSSAIRSLADDGVFVLLEEGAGSRPAFYGNPEHHKPTGKEESPDGDESKNEEWGLLS